MSIKRRGEIPMKVIATQGAKKREKYIGQNGWQLKAEEGLVDHHYTAYSNVYTGK
jgi:hypothetical protein